MSSARQTFYFDIDGTLLYAKGSGRIAFVNAFYDVFGARIDISHINFYGATDLGVIKDLLCENEIKFSDDKITKFFDRLAYHLEINLKNSPPKLYPGVLNFLEKVIKTNNLALITGNTFKCAHLKLKYAGINHFFSNIGGYGDDHSCRNEIARIAINRVSNPLKGFLFGDTPKDIEAAKVNNLISIALCTGIFKKKEFIKHNPSLILDSFENVDIVLDKLRLLRD